MDIKILYTYDPEWEEWSDQIKYEKSFVHSAIILFDKEEIIGQQVVYFNPHHKINESSCISIGNISMPDNKVVFEAFHNIVVELAMKMKVQYIISPMDGSTWNNYRFVSEQTKAPFLLETTSDDYYITQYKDLGYEVLASYFSQETYELTENWQKTRNRYQFFLEHGMTFDKFDLSVAKQEFQELATFCNAAFRKNFFFSPIKEKDFVEKMMQVIPILNPEYTIIARSEGAVAGFFFAYQDLHNKEEKSLVIKTLARDIDRPFGGLGAVLTSIGMEAAIRDGFTHCIHALMIDHNASAILSDKYNGRIRSRYELLYYTL